MTSRFRKQDANHLDRNGLDCKAAQFSHVDAVDPERQESDLRDERRREGLVLSARLSERSTANAIKDYRGADYLDRHNVLKDDPEKYSIKDSAMPSGTPPEDLLPIPDAWTATIEQNKRLTPDDHWQDVRHLTLVVDPKLIKVKPVVANARRQDPRAQYSGTQEAGSSVKSSRKSTRTGAQDAKQPVDKIPPANHTKTVVERELPESLWTSAGDTLVLYPKNFPEDVQTLIELMEWQEFADVPFKHYRDRDDLFSFEHAPPGCYPMENSTLRQLLINNYDITAIPKRTFFDNIRFFTTDEMHKERLGEFSDARYIDEFYDYTTRPRRSILEILQDFPSVKIPYQYIPAVFPLIRGREYSIASSGVLADTEGNDDATRVELLIAVVKYKTVLRKTRRGLCSRYVESLRPGTKVRIGIRDRGAPFANLESIRQPLVCIATGTGLAPIRAAFWERSLEQDHGPNVLFFGARNEKADYFFKDEWPLLNVNVHTAFSRDQRQKIYVQDVIRREYKLLCAMIQQKAAIMLCGSSGKMPDAVRSAICDAMTKGGLAKTEQDARDYLDENNLLWEEVW